MLYLMIVFASLVSPVRSAEPVQYSPDAIELANVLKHCTSELEGVSAFRAISATHAKPDSGTDIYEIRLIGGGAPGFGPPSVVILKITQTQDDRPSTPDRPTSSTFSCGIISGV